MQDCKKRVPMVELYASAFLRATSVVRQRCDVFDRLDRQARRLQRRHGAFPTGAGTLHQDLQLLDAVFGRFLCRLLRREAGIREFVLSFRHAPLRSLELRDILRYGRSAAPAHLALAAGLRGRLRADARLWLLPAVSSDQNLDNPAIAYSGELLAGLSALDSRIGIVWSGPAALSPAIDAADRDPGRASGNSTSRRPG